ncbi:HAMP domain-containing histidine kinase [Paenibacillus sp. IB182363]|uniref:histidine kinase n=1 Tax=Paenibacillus oceani TaxID=2772510 RepID=A0A927CGF4_9BACL|nr:HAMP domain-containing histidine kinase [Paenibacillus oceani]
MKNKPLFVQIWLVIAGITSGITLLILVVIPLFLGDFFTREIYNTIEDAQNSLFAGRQQDRLADRWLEGSNTVERDQQQLNIRTVRHVLITDDGKMAPNLATLTADFRQQLIAEARSQTSQIQRYSHALNNENLFYVIRSESYRGTKLYVMSYMWDAHRNKLVRELSFRLFLILGLIMLFSWIPALWLAKYLSRPLVKLESYVKHIADRNWKEPIELDRKDEIGRLAVSMEQTRRQLLRQDETKQSFLQHISHELKTPVMVIRSYAQSIQDGIYPKGDLQTSVDVIDQEAERLEKRIRSLLYLTKLDYLSTQKQVRLETVRLDRLAEEVVDRLRWKRPELEWSLQLDPLTVRGDREQWTIALENMLDNQIRYAASGISVSTEAVGPGGGGGLFKVRNDGPPIEPDLLAGLFGEFRKGQHGEFGLGLAIVKRIADLHQASVTAVNTAEGVEFRVTFG